MEEICSAINASLLTFEFPEYWFPEMKPRMKKKVKNLTVLVEPRFAVLVHAVLEFDYVSYSVIYNGKSHGHFIDLNKLFGVVCRRKPTYFMGQWGSTSIYVVAKPKKRPLTVWQDHPHYPFKKIVYVWK